MLPTGVELALPAGDEPVLETFEEFDEPHGDQLVPNMMPEGRVRGDWTING